MLRGVPASAVLFFATAAYAANQPSTRPQLLSRGLREVMLRQVDQSTPDQSDRAHAEWYTPDAEALLQRLLSGLPEAPTSQRKSKGNPVEGWDGFDTEALFLLCRAQMGCLESALKELDRASRMVAHVREKWQLISGGTASQIFNENVMRAARATRRLALLTARGLSMRKISASTNHSLDGISGDGVSGEITAASAAADLEAGDAPDPPGPSDESPPAERESPLGSPHSRLGMGARRRALLRSERAMAAHAGALHDLRVALSAAGGEWLELGRWLGGPPLPEMEWEVRAAPWHARRARTLTCAMHIPCTCPCLRWNGWRALPRPRPIHPSTPEGAHPTPALSPTVNSTLVPTLSSSPSLWPGWP